ncbi:uncharacterized protein sb:cb1058 isoform X2 [Brienomyrus brachyistius]|uniref:uncharacterized protein sb:cb1058 isoform X2 n=1 Tax=Brienomyrus brachyistius TaxID=42636 RepID=UPI0020B35F5E|nr:uncharacterized protein sb:cb1058 isoform X2 [Brienomyrus brachyistius]
MTIGKTRKKSLKFLDRADGSYWLLDEMEVPREGEPIQQEQDIGRMGSGDEREAHSTPSRVRSDNREPDVFDFNTGMMEDDGTAMLLRRKPGRISARWRRRGGSKKWSDRRTEVYSTNKENVAPPAHMTEETKNSQHAEEEMKAVKKKSLRNYTRAIDRAFRRGWETFVANLNSVTLSPISASPPSSHSPTEIGHRSSLAEYR